MKYFVVVQEKHPELPQWLNAFLQALDPAPDGQSNVRWPREGVGVIAVELSDDEIRREQQLENLGRLQFVTDVLPYDPMELECLTDCCAEGDEEMDD